MTIAYFDCFNGAAGDMIVAALIDAGANEAALRQGFESLGVGGYSLTIEKTEKQGFTATRFKVDLKHPGQQPHRHLKDVISIIEKSGLPRRVMDKAAHVFQRLAQAEAAVHCTAIEKVHFHEVGAVDAVIDVVGTVLGLELLGVERVLCSPIPVGSGTIRCDHGIMPVPAPATAELLKGVPIAASDEPGELTTPTGAALLTALAAGFGPIPGMTLKAIGYGAGTRDGQTRPNVLRVLIGEAVDEAGQTMDDTCAVDEITVLETHLDDATPQLIAYCTERLLAEGALDVYSVPIHMKKSRSGVLVTVLCEHDQVASMERILFTETTTFGIRRHAVRRTKLRRKHEPVTTPYGVIRMKIGGGQGAVTVTPEFEDCKAAATTHHVALRQVIAAANAAWAGRV